MVSSAKKILFSFVIPALNEEQHIGGVIDAVHQYAGQDESALEIIVVDNGSTDRTTQIAAEKGAKVVKQTEGTIAHMRNVGTAESSGEILVFIDADVYLTEDWHEHIGQTLAYLQDHPQTVTGSYVGMRSEMSWIERYWFKGELKKVNPGYMNSGHLIVPREFFDKIGGFDKSLRTGEDSEFGARAREFGGEIVNNPSLRVEHYGYPQTLKEFFNRERWHGEGAFASLELIVSSKVALLTLANAIALVLVAAVSLFFWDPVLLLIYPLFLIGISGLGALSRCGSDVVSLVPSVLICMVYFTARTFALVDVLFKSTFEHRSSRS